MNRLWVRMSIRLTAVVLLAALAPLGVILLLVALRAFLQVDPTLAGGLIDYFDSYWVLAFEENLDDVVTLIFTETDSIFLFAFSLTLVMGITAGVWVSRQFARPISILAQGTHQLRDGELGHQISLDDPTTELQALAGAFNAMSDELAQAERLRRSLMADVSHELRTPLTVLEGKLRAALDGLYTLDDAAIANLYSQTSHLVKLVEDLHLLALAESSQLPISCEITDIPQLLNEVAWNFEFVAAEKGIDLQVVAPDRLLWSVDSGRLRQVLGNLVSNGIRHTPAGGTLKLKVALASTLPANRLQMSVSDSGEGVPVEQLPHLFDRFYRTDSSRTRETGGSGLGLAIVKAVVEAHKGRIWAESAGKDQGTAFWLEFPQNAQQQSSPANTARSSPSASGSMSSQRANSS